MDVATEEKRENISVHKYTDLISFSLVWNPIRIKAYCLKVAWKDKEIVVNY